MDTLLLHKENEMLKKSNQHLKLMSLLLGASLLVTVLKLYNTNERITIQHWNGSDSYQVTGTESDKHRLSGLSKQVANTMLNLTPNNIAQAQKDVLYMTTPSQHEAISQQIERYGKEIKRKRITTVFISDTAEVFEDELKVAVEGYLSIYKKGKEVRDKSKRKRKRYILEYKRFGYKFLLDGFYEEK